MAAAPAPTLGKGDMLSADTVASRFNAVKVHAWRGKYPRVFALTASAVHNLDPSNFSITNSWPWSDVIDFAPAVSSLTEFSFTVRVGKKPEVLKYTSDDRNALLCELQRLHAGEKEVKRMMAVKITRASARLECVLEIGSWFLAQASQDGRRYLIGRNGDAAES